VDKAPFCALRFLWYLSVDNDWSLLKELYLKILMLDEELI